MKHLFLLMFTIAFAAKAMAQVGGVQFNVYMGGQSASESYVRSFLGFLDGKAIGNESIVIPWDRAR